MKPNVVIDTNVIVAALKSRRGASNKLLGFIDTKKFIYNISVALILEYEAVIKRLFKNLTNEKVNYLLDYICANGEKTKIYYLWRPCLKDSADDMVLEIAVASEARFIVTYNQKDFEAARNFGIKLITPKELLGLIGELT